MSDRVPDRYISSTQIGDRALLGQVGTVGHVQIGSDVTVLGRGY